MPGTPTIEKEQTKQRREENRVIRLRRHAEFVADWPVLARTLATAVIGLVENNGDMRAVAELAQAKELAATAEKHRERFYSPNKPGEGSPSISRANFGYSRFDGSSRRDWGTDLSDRGVRFRIEVSRRLFDQSAIALVIAQEAAKRLLVNDQLQLDLYFRDFDDTTLEVRNEDEWIKKFDPETWGYTLPINEYDGSRAELQPGFRLFSEDLVPQEAIRLLVEWLATQHVISPEKAETVISESQPLRDWQDGRTRSEARFELSEHVVLIYRSYQGGYSTPDSYQISFEVVDDKQGQEGEFAQKKAVEDAARRTTELEEQRLGQQRTLRESFSNPELLVQKVEALKLPADALRAELPLAQLFGSSTIRWLVSLSEVESIINHSGTHVPVVGKTEWHETNGRYSIRVQAENQTVNGITISLAGETIEKIERERLIKAKEAIYAAVQELFKVTSKTYSIDDIYARVTAHDETLTKAMGEEAVRQVIVEIYDELVSTAVKAAAKAKFEAMLDAPVPAIPSDKDGGLNASWVFPREHRAGDTQLVYEVVVTVERKDASEMQEPGLKDRYGVSLALKGV